MPGVGLCQCLIFESFLYVSWPVELFEHPVMLFQSPMLLFLKLTVPVVDEEDEEMKGWNRHLNCLQCFTGPTFFIFSTDREPGFCSSCGMFCIPYSTGSQRSKGESKRAREGRKKSWSDRTGTSLFAVFLLAPSFFIFCYEARVTDFVLFCLILTGSALFLGCFVYVTLCTAEKGTQTRLQTAYLMTL